MAKNYEVKRRYIIPLLLLTAFVLPDGVRAFDFVPTEAEWMAWPESCKAKFVGDNPSTYPEFFDRVTPDMKDRARAYFGSCWLPAHHYCGALHKFTRAMAVINKHNRDFLLRDAMAEHFFVRKNGCPRDNPFWSENETRVAIIQDALGRTSEAMTTLDEAEKAHPDFAGQYVVRARLLKKAGKASEARAVLEKGNERTAGASAEIQYALGLSLLNAKEYEQARVHARQAYALGYPLPWLRDQLAKRGYPL